MSTDTTNPGTGDPDGAGAQGEALKVQEVLSGVQSEGAGANVCLRISRSTPSAATRW